MKKLNIFISHSSQNEQTAGKLKACIKSAFLGQHRMFLSSELPAGEDWFKEINRFLRGRRELVTIVVVTPGSLRRPWVWFEVGASWHAEAKVISVCSAGMTPSKLPDPLRRWVAVQLNKAGLAHLLKTIAKLSDCSLDDSNVESAVRTVFPKKGKSKRK